MLFLWYVLRIGLFQFKYNKVDVIFIRQCMLDK